MSDKRSERREAKLRLIDKVNEGFQKKNQQAIALYRERRRSWLKGFCAMPSEPWLLKTFSRRSLNQAVFTARQKGGFEAELAAAGF